MRLAGATAWSSVRGMTGLLAVAAVLAVSFLAPRAWAAVVVADCSTACVLKNGQTHIDFPDEMVVITGLITPLPGSTTVRVFAREIVVDGASGGAITVTGKGRSLELDASGMVLVSGDLLSSNSNGKIIVTAVDRVQIERASLESGGNMEIECTGSGCPLNLLRARLRANRIFVDVRGDIFWDGNRIDTFGPRDMVEIESRTGSVRKTGAIAVALRSGRIVTLPQGGRVDAVSEAAAFCETCLEPTPTPTPPGPTTTETVFATATLPGGFSPTPPSTATPEQTPTPEPTDIATPPATGTPAETPEATGTPSETPVVTSSPVEVMTPTPTATPTDTATATPAPTPTPADCNHIIGGVESALILRAAGDIDARCDRYLIARDITIAAGGSIDLTGAEVRNDFGKCGDIEITGPVQVAIEGAILVDDDCRNRPDVSRINGREQVPHTGFNAVVGTPLIDD